MPRAKTQKPKKAQLPIPGQKQPNNIVVFKGDAGLIDAEITKAISAFSPNDIFRVYASETENDDIIKLVITPPMFGDKKLIIIRGDFDIDSIVHRIPQKNCIIIVGPKTNTKCVKIIDFGQLKPVDMKIWIEKKLDALKLKYDSKIITALSEYGPDNTAAMSNELTKIQTYCGNEKITLDVLQEICQAEVDSNIWGLIDHLDNLNAAGAINMFNREWQESETVERIIPILQWHYRLLILIASMRERGNTSTQQIASEILDLKKIGMSKSEYNEFRKLPEEERKKIIEKCPSIYKSYTVQKYLLSSLAYTSREFEILLIELYNIWLACRSSLHTLQHVLMTMFLLRACKKIPLRIS